MLLTNAKIGYKGIICPSASFPLGVLGYTQIKFCYVSKVKKINLMASRLMYIMQLLNGVMHCGGTFSSVFWSIVLASGNVLTVAGSPVNGEASSPPPAINDNRPSGDNLDTILFQLRQVTRERDELRKRLALASPGTTFDDCRCKFCLACQVVVVFTVFFSSGSTFYLADIYESVYCDYR